MASVKMHLDKKLCNSIYQKTGNKSTGTTLSMLKIYSRCLICFLKVKYTKIKFPYFTTDLACWTASLPAIRPSSTMARAPVFHTIKVIALDLQTVVPKNVYPLCHDASSSPLLVSFHLQIAYRKVRNLRIGVNKLVG